VFIIQPLINGWLVLARVVQDILWLDILAFTVIVVGDKWGTKISDILNRPKSRSVMEIFEL